MMRIKHDFRPLVIRDRVSLGSQKIYMPSRMRQIVGVRARLLKRPHETYYRSMFSIQADGLHIIDVSGAALNKPVRLDVDCIVVDPPFGIVVAFSTRQEQADDEKHQVEFEIVMKSVRRR